MKAATPNSKGRRSARVNRGAKKRAPVNEPRLGPDEVAAGEDGALWIPLDRIVPFANQPRKEFDEAEMQALSNSITAVGQKSPGQVRELQGGDDPRFELVDGERRWRACRTAGKTHFRAIVVNVSHEQQYIDSVALNFGRANHSPGEVLEIIFNLKQMGKNNAQIAAILGRSVAFVSQYQELFRLHPEIRMLLGPPTPREERLAVTIARALAQLEQGSQLEAWQEISRGVVTLRRAQTVVRQALEAGAERNASIRTRTRTASDVVRLIRGRLGAILDQLATLADDPMLPVVLEEEWREQRELALEQLEDILLDTEDLLGKLRGDEVVESRGKRAERARKDRQKAARDPENKAQAAERSRKRMLAALGAMAETLFDFRTNDGLETMFCGQPFAVVNFARMSTDGLIKEALLLEQRLPSVEDRHRYDPTARLDGGEDEVGDKTGETDELDFDVDQSAAPDSL